MSNVTGPLDADIWRAIYAAAQELMRRRTGEPDGAPVLAPVIVRVRLDAGPVISLQLAPAPAENQGHG
jgi:hypothetical protein